MRRKIWKEGDLLGKERDLLWKKRDLLWKQKRPTTTTSLILRRPHCAHVAAYLLLPRVLPGVSDVFLASVPFALLPPVRVCMCVCVCVCVFVCVCVCVSARVRERESERDK